MSARPLPDPDPGDESQETPAVEPEGPTVPQGATPEPTAEDVEARWRDIVTQLGELADPGPPRRRASDRPLGGTPDGEPPQVPPAAPRPGEQGPGARTVRPVEGHRDWAPDPAAEEADDHFVPPDPGPVLGGDPLLTMAWLVAAAVPLLLLVSVIVWRDVPPIVLQAAGVGFVGAVGLLLWRMPHRKDEDDGPGAVV